MTVPLANTYTKIESNILENNGTDCRVGQYLHKDRA
jgi:hypothetical protein